MEDITDKIENSGATADGRHSADEYNDRNNELETAVERSGQALTVAETTQLSEAIFLNSTKAASFQDNGALNAVDLRPLSGASGVKIPADYSNMDGAIVQFKPAANNTGAVTVDIGQTAGIGVKSLVLSDTFGALVGGELDTTLYAQIQYDLGGDRWLLMPWTLPAASVSFPILVSQGGTGATNAGDARTNLDVPPNARAVNSAGLLTGGATLASDINLNVPPSSQAQAEAGVDNTTGMTPLRVAQAIAALGVGGGLTGIQTFTAGGTWNRPVGVKTILVLAVGGGAGGGFTNSATGEAYGGGGAGGHVITFVDVNATPSLLVTIGAGGNAGTIGTPAGTAGGATSLGGVAIAAGGATSLVATGGDGGVGTTGAVLTKGGAGDNGTVDDPGGSVNTAGGGQGGSSFWGGAGRGGICDGIVITNALAGSQGGGGGGGASQSFGTANPAAGGNGLVVVIEFS